MVHKEQSDQMDNCFFGIFMKITEEFLGKISTVQYGLLLTENCFPKINP
jgi:hypothetical protein